VALDEGCAGIEGTWTVGTTLGGGGGGVSVLVVAVKVEMQRPALLLQHTRFGYSPSILIINEHTIWPP